MSTYLDKTGATYYFRRPVPKDLLGVFTTATGKLRTEWKISLRTKDREAAKRLLPSHAMATDKLIDEARAELAKFRPGAALGTPVVAPTETGRLQELAEAQAALERAKQERYEARRNLRVEVRQRMMLSTAELSPQEAAWRDLVREAGQTTEALQEAAEGQRAANQAIVSKRSRQVTRLLLLELFDRYAASGSANPKTVRRWRKAVQSLIGHLGHGDASRVQRADINGWAAALIAKGLAKKTVVDGYLPAVRAAFAIAYDDGALSVNPVVGVRVRGPKAAKLRERDHTE